MKCLYCGKELTNRQTKYCSNKCQMMHKSQNLVEQWKKGEHDGLRGTNQVATFVRNYMIEKAGNRCELCGWHEINPYTGLVPLEIHHKDGDYRNNTENNLQVLCPNCHSLTSSYRALNKEGREDRDIDSRKHYCVDCGAPVSFGAIRCKACETKNRVTQKPVTKEELKTLIRTTPFTKIAEQYGVTDNAIRKWCDQYGLPRKKSDINNIPDEEWENL